MPVFRKILFFALAFSMLNQSIDSDFITYGFNQRTNNYDDVDCLVELIIEQIAGDQHYTHESDDDSGIAHHSAGKHHVTFPYYAGQFKKIISVLRMPSVQSWPVGIHHSATLSEGFYSIDFPPPRS